MALLRTRHWCSRHWATCTAPLACSSVLPASSVHRTVLNGVVRHPAEPVNLYFRLLIHATGPRRRNRHTRSNITARAAVSSSSNSLTGLDGSLADGKLIASNPQSSSSSACKQPADKALRVERLLANLGYGKRQECTAMIKRKRVVYAATGSPAKVSEKACSADLLLDGAPLDPAPPLTIILHKPVGYVVTSPNDENVTDPKVYDLLPYRFGRRRPSLSSIGRLDKETSGLLLLTDDGQLLHSIQSPVRGIWKVYVAELASPLEGREAAAAVRRFASGLLQLQGDRTPLLPAALRMTGPTTAEVAICEGRYHQIRRMFAALGHHIVGLHRRSVGGLRLADDRNQQTERRVSSSSSSDAIREVALAEGMWRYATAEEIAAVMTGPDLQERLVIQQQEKGQEHNREGGARPSQQQCQQSPQSGRHVVQDSHIDGSSAVGQHSSSESSESGEDVQQAVGLSINNAAWYAAVSSQCSSSSSSGMPVGGSLVSIGSDVVGGADVGDGEGEMVEDQLSAVKRYRDSSRWARRQAAVARGVQTLKKMQQPLL